MEQLHEYEHENSKSSHKEFHPLGEDDELVIIRRGETADNFKEFSVSYRTTYNSKKITVSRHCWQKDHVKFHTHVRIKTGEGRDKFQTIYPPPLRGNIKRALNWAIDDMHRNWYHYCRHFEKLVKWEASNET